MEAGVTWVPDLQAETPEGVPAAAQGAPSAEKVHVNDDKNSIPNKALKQVVADLSKQGMIFDGVFKATANGSDVEALIDSMCLEYNTSIDENKKIHVVLDTTLQDVSSEAVKYFTRALELPTVSASCGQEGDLRRRLSWWENMYKKNLSTICLPRCVCVCICVGVGVFAYLPFSPQVIKTLLFSLYAVMDHKYKSLLQNVPTRHIINEIKFQNIANQLSTFKQREVFNYFILGRMDTVNKVLEAAADMEFYGRQFGWYAITQDEGNPSCQKCGKGASVLHVKPNDAEGTVVGAENPKLAYQFYYELFRNTFLAIGQMIKEESWPDMQYIPCEEYEENKNVPPTRKLNLLEALQQISMLNPGAYGQLMLSSNGHSHMQFNMTAFNVSLSDNSATEVGTWAADLDSPFITKVKPSVPVTQYTVVVALQQPFVIKYQDENGNTKFKGYCIDLINAIRNITNFEIEIYEVADGKFGNMDEEGRWNGMIKDLIDKKAHIALGALSVMAERENVVDFTVPYYDLVGITILMKKPKTPTSLFKFLTVLENDVWLCILAAYFFTSFLMWVFDRWSPYSYQNNREKYKDDEEKREFDLKECLWFCMTSLTPQGGGEAPKNLSGRLVAATWWLFGFIIIASYTANLAAFLTVSRLDTPVESLDDLSKQYKIQYAPIANSSAHGGGEAPKNLSGRLVAATWWLFGFIIIASYTANLAAFLTVSRLDTPVESLDDLSKQYKIQYAPIANSSAHVYFQRMAAIENRFYEIWKDMSLNDSLSEVERAKLAVWDYPVSDKYTKILQAMTEAGFPANIEEALERVRASKSSSEGFAFIGDATDIRYQVLTNCDLQMVGEEFSRKPYAIAVQQGSPLKDQFNNAILQLLNKRKLEKLKEQWWNQNPEKRNDCEKQDDQSDGISIQNIGGVFIVIFVGIGLACITLAFEYWWYKLRPQHNAVVEAAPPRTKSDSLQALNMMRSSFDKRYGRRQGVALAGVTNPW
uniref:Ionotropic receptor 25a n=1 Tax=Locusta migratoria TaxID=7004 RepID=A0A0M4J2T6_LOCMI|nr:ionotropic receptor 25a [Locusta migratoria]